MSGNGSGKRTATSNIEVGDGGGSNANSCEQADMPMFLYLLGGQGYLPVGHTFLVNILIGTPYRGAMPLMLYKPCFARACPMKSSTYEIKNDINLSDSGSIIAFIMLILGASLVHAAAYYVSALDEADGVVDVAGRRLCRSRGCGRCS